MHSRVAIALLLFALCDSTGFAAGNHHPIRSHQNAYRRSNIYLKKALSHGGSDNNGFLLDGGAVITPPKPGAAPVQANKLYSLQVDCKLYPITASSFLGVDDVLSLNEVLTLSTSPYSTSIAPNNLVALIPIDLRVLSRSNPTDFRTSTCSQKYLVTGHQLYLSVVFSHFNTKTPGAFLQFLSGALGIAPPVIGVIPPFSAAESAAKQASGLIGSYSPFLAALSTQPESIDSKKLAVGTFQIHASNKDDEFAPMTPTAYTSVTVTPVASLIDALNTPEFYTIFESQYIAPNVALIQKDQTTCVGIGRQLKISAGLSQKDVGRILAEAIYDSGISMDKAASCLTDEFGSTVIGDQFWKDHVGVNALTAADFPALKPQRDEEPFRPYNRKRLEGLLAVVSLYIREKDKARQGDDAKLLTGFLDEKKVELSDFTGAFSDKDANSAPFSPHDVATKDLIDDLAEYSFVGCPDTPDTYNDSSLRPAAADFLVAPKPRAAGALQITDLVLVRVWWRGSVDEPKITEMTISREEDVIAKILKDDQNVCDADFKVSTPSGDPQK
ncbi:MAG: hypothetical protein AB1508_11515 [Pseudomonadota bacterium]